MHSLFERVPFQRKGVGCSKREQTPADTTTTTGRYFRDSTFQALQTIEQAVDKHGLTMIETALRWVVHHSALRVKDGNDGVIIGVSSIDQLGQNLDALEKGPLPEDLLQSLDEAWRVSKVDAVPYWHGEVKYHYDPRQVLFAPGAK